MSLDNTSHPGRPGLDELVPSRYALRVGEIDVLVVSDGVLSLPGAMLGHNADPAVRAAWLDDMFLPPDVHPLARHTHGPHWRAARRRGEGPAASGPADPLGGRRGPVLGVARFLPRLHAAGVPGRASADGQ